VLTDFDRFDEWNPVIRKVARNPHKTVVISVAAPSGLLDWNVEVIRVDSGREFAWRFSESAAVLYRGEDTFRTEAIDAHPTRYIDRETFNGILVPLRKRRLGTKTKAGMVAMGAALKHRVENNNGP
jgi:hypothetical protein